MRNVWTIARREYSRFFGQPPMRDVRTLRSPGASPTEVMSSR